ncbi:MAG: shikimate dehydrogenase [Candidatus Hydrothermarchaeaceae archaeon]
MKIDARTEIFCVIGDPIEHSLSPAMHNAVFERLGLNCCYTAFRINPGDLGDAIKGMQAIAIGGINVTIPHKVSVMEFLDDLSDEARIIGAVNTIEMGEKLKGYNTDGVGALRALKNGGADPKGRHILLLGSGGAARAIAVTLALKGEISSLSILGIVKEEVEKLASDVSANTPISAAGALLDDGTLKDGLSTADILIHATPIGMHPDTDKTIVTADMMRPDLKVMDVVYTPLETKLMREAKNAGVGTLIGGLDMFVNQGAEAEKIWLDIDAPLELMREVVLGELSE